YMCEIDVKNKKFKVTLHLDENLRGAFITECSKAFSIIMDTLRNFGRCMVWDHNIGVLISGAMRVGSGDQTQSGKVA
ncbi:MAG: hypothetical protein ACKO3T_01095, partial [Planctomycetaceae bacterium]